MSIIIVHRRPQKDRLSPEIKHDENLDHPSISIVLNVRVFSSHVMIVDTKRDQIRRRVVGDDNVGLRKIVAKEREDGQKHMVREGERERDRSA